MTSPGPEALTVLVPHYGDPAPALALLESLRAQAPGAQYVVVDDHSPVPFPEVAGLQVVRRGANGGFGAAVNTGAALAERDLLLLLNSDLAVGPTFVADLLAAAAPWLPAVCGPVVLDAEGRHDHGARHFPTARQQVVEWLSPLARYRESLHEQVGHDTRCVPGAVLPTDWLVGAALLLPTAAFRDVGGFDERFFMNCEEVDLQRRLRERGLPAVHLGTVSVTHAKGGSSVPEQRLRWLVQSRRAYAEKWGGRRSRLALQAGLTAATGANLAANAVRRARGTDVQPLARARQELDLIWR